MATKRVLSEEERHSLIGVNSFSSSATINITPAIYSKKKRDKDGNETQEELIPLDLRPSFSIRAFTKVEAEAARKLFKRASKEAGSVTVEETRSLIRKVVMGWSNFFDVSSGEEVEYKADNEGGASKELVNEYFSDGLIDSLLNHVSAISGLIDPQILGLKF